MTKPAISRHRRAPNRAIARYSPNTVREYEGQATRWRRYAKACDFDPRLPGVDDLIGYFVAVRAAHGSNRVRRSSWGLSWYFQSEHMPNLIDDPRVAAEIWRETPLEDDPMGAVTAASAALTLSARRYADSAYSERTHHGYTQAARAWVAWANAAGADPLLPGIDAFLEYVAELAQSYAAATIRNRLNAIAHYFDGRAPDLTKDRRVVAVVEGVRRIRPPRQYPALYVGDVRKMVRSIDTPSPTGARNVLLVILMALGGLAIRHVRALDVARRKELEDGVMFFTDLPRMREIFIGESGDPDLSVRTWLARWLAILGDRPGSLFPGLVDGSFGLMPMDHTGVRSIVTRMAKRAGVWKPGISPTSLRIGFVRNATVTVGAAQTAAVAGYASPDSVVDGYAAQSEWARERRLRNLRRKPKWRLTRRRTQDRPTA